MSSVGKLCHGCFTLSENIYPRQFKDRVRDFFSKLIKLLWIKRVKFTEKFLVFLDPQSSL